MMTDPKAWAERKEAEFRTALNRLGRVKVLSRRDDATLPQEMAGAHSAVLRAHREALLAAGKVARIEGIETLGHVRSCRCDYAPTMDRSGEDPRCRAERDRLAAEVAEMAGGSESRNECIHCSTTTCDCNCHKDCDSETPDADPKE